MSVVILGLAPSDGGMVGRVGIVPVAISLLDYDRYIGEEGAFIDQHLDKVVGRNLPHCLFHTIINHRFFDPFFLRPNLK